MPKSQSVFNDTRSDCRQHILKSGDRFGYDVLGCGQKKVFFFHGFPAGRLQGHLLEAYCDEYDLQICSFDRPGYGLSEFKRLPRGYKGLAEVLEEVAESWGWNDVHLIAVSGGTPYALAWAAQSSRVASLHTVCGLGPLREDAFREGFSPSYLQMMRAASLTPEFALNRLLPFSGGPGKSTKIAGYDLSRFFTRHSVRDAFQQGVRGAKLDIANYLGADAIDWDSIRCPTTIWHGTADNVVPARFAELMKERIPHADLRLKRGESHYSLPLQHGRAILAEIRENHDLRSDIQPKQA